MDVLGDLIARDPLPVAYRTRADCFMQLGETSNAIRDYRTYCRGAPDAPGVSEVRDILAGVGATCP